MVDLVDRQLRHHRLGTLGKLNRLPHMIRVIFSDLSIKLVRDKQQVLVVAVKLAVCTKACGKVHSS